MTSGWRQATGLRYKLQSRRLRPLSEVGPPARFTIAREAEPREAEQHHRPCGGLRYGQNGYRACGCRDRLRLPKAAEASRLSKQISRRGSVRCTTYESTVCIRRKVAFV